MIAPSRTWRSAAVLGLAISALSASGAALAAPAKSEPAAAAVDRSAMQAASRMGAFLGGLKSFEVTSTVTLGATENGVERTIPASATYKVRRPDAFVIDMSAPEQTRRFIYDGKSFTVFAPKPGYFASVSAPPTIRETLEAVYNEYGIGLPLADLLYWGDGAAPTDLVEAARRVGADTVNGVAADHYAFRGPDLNWELWIQRGSQPLPVKIVITSPDDPDMATYSATLKWNLNPSFAADTFVFQRKDAKPIALARVQP